MRWCIALVLAGCGFRHGALSEIDSGVDSADDVDAAIDAMIDAPLPSTCGNGQPDGDETDLDCDGSCTPCGLGKMCSVSTDCLAAVCGSGSTCRRAVSCGELHQAQPALVIAR